MPIRRPTALKVLDGVSPSRINTDEATPLSEKPKMPGWFSLPQQQTWRHVVRQLDGMGMLAAADYDSLVNFVLCADTARRIACELNDSTLIMTGASGAPMANPLLVAMDRAIGRTMHLARQFGLTPSSRASLRMSLAAPDTEANANGPVSWFSAG